MGSHHNATPLSGAFLIMALVTGGGCGISREREISLGREVRPMLEQRIGGLDANDALQRYVDAVGQRLVKHTPRRDLPWEFRVLQSDRFNAFAVPGGFVYVTTALLSKLEDEAQLAAVLAHEVGHVTDRHTLRQLVRTQVLSPTDPELQRVVGGLTWMKYTPDQEKEADLRALSYLVRAGYDPEGLVELMQLAEREAENSGRDSPEFFGMHTNPADRHAYLRETIRRKYAGAAAAGRTGREQFHRIVTPPATP